MKNKKSLFVLVLVALVLVLGVGYAVVNSVSLNVTGSAQTETTNLKVAITAASPNDNTAAVYGTVNSPANLSATFSVTGLSAVNPTGTITYTVTNSDTVAAKVYLDTITGTNEFFTATVDRNTEANAIVIQPSQTGTFTVTVTMVKAPITAQDSTLNNITVTMHADPVAAS